MRKYFGYGLKNIKTGELVQSHDGAFTVSTAKQAREARHGDRSLKVVRHLADRCKGCGCDIAKGDEYCVECEDDGKRQ